MLVVFTCVQRKEERKRKKAEWTKKSALNAERQVILGKQKKQFVCSFVRVLITYWLIRRSDGVSNSEGRKS